ncbi:30S ribosomal protein S11 [bacterium]|nr:30S ribosomal protein S11 [bacterium]MDB4287748.1 30S ribosomal protein S11 [bacterium]MDB4306340.1 30S ribosomal protein S11 [bacterium]MDB4716358.1 30S ribosomal protein S11 [bacterium]MDC0265317.1 30S ribosomal protein S11 [bacterium]
MAEEENKNEEPEVVDAKAETPTETPAPEAAAEEAAPEASSDAPAAGEATEAKSEEGEAAVKKPEEKRDIFAELLGEEAPDKVKIHKSKKSKNVTKGIVHVKATFNNTIVSVTDERGNSIGWSSAGKMGFRGSRKSTAYAAQVVSQDACRQAMAHGLKEVEVRVKGPGAGRESAVRAVQAVGVDVNTIEDVTAIPHNGCRPKKARRV